MKKLKYFTLIIQKTEKIHLFALLLVNILK